MFGGETDEVGEFMSTWCDPDFKGVFWPEGLLKGEENLVHHSEPQGLNCLLVGFRQ